MIALLVICTVVLVVFMISSIYASLDRKRQNEKWPPISDDEFLAKCTPGTSRDTALRVRRIVSEQLGIEYERVHPEQDFVRDLGC